MPRLTKRTLRPLPLLAAVLLSLVGCTSAGPDRSPATLEVLTCHDSVGQQGLTAAPAHLVNGVDGFIGDTDSTPLYPRVIGGRHYFAWKSALSVARDARPYRTVSVVSPSSARLRYSLAVDGKPPARSVRMPACGRRFSLFLGGIYVVHPACVTLSVRGPDHPATIIRVPVKVPRC